ncbi:MAG: glycosyltransferase family 2 protein, partial [Candidatus Heimdallarchaeota archaeon]|nr:glycosyltransferase family 2 protein [Candidatus Heimdallarchaeota archaeon]
METPLISIIIPTYNREKLILNALDSIFNQTFQDYEILIIDDASTDNTEQVIKELNHSKIKYLKLEKNSGQCIARNFGAKRAQGQFIAFLDSDDEWLPQKLENQVRIFNEGSDRLGAVYGYSYQKDVIKDETVLRDSGYFRGNIHGKMLTGFCPPTPSLFVVKRSVFESVQGFD